MEKTSEDNAMKQTQRTVLICGVALTIGAVAFFDAHAALSVLLGAAVASLNLYVLSRTVQSLVEGQRGSWAGVAVIKFLVLLAVTYALIQSGWALPLGLAVGFGALPIGILISGTIAAPPLSAGPTGPTAKTDHA